MSERNKYKSALHGVRYGSDLVITGGVLEGVTKLLANGLSSLTKPLARAELKKIKSEFRQGIAVVKYYEYGLPCHTRCDFEYSSGEFSTTLDPTESPWGEFKLVSGKVVAMNQSDKKWFIKKAHHWAQGNVEINSSLYQGYKEETQ